MCRQHRNMFFLLLIYLCGTGLVAGQIPDECEEIDAPGAWGLDRIDQRDKLASQDEENSEAKYIIGPYLGEDVTVYVVGTGIDTKNPEFERRASWGYTADGIPAGKKDDNGDGTHVAGIIGSKSFGVAKKVKLVAVKVLGANGKGTFDTITDGLEWILEDHQKRCEEDENCKSIASTPFLGPQNDKVFAAAKALIDANIILVAAAGNNNDDACERSAGGVEGAITVGAMNIREKVAIFSNWGTCVDLYAPGMNIKSTVLRRKTELKTGTAQAAAHVAGAAALKLSKESMTPEDMKTWLTDVASKDKLTFPNDDHATSPNLLLYVNCLLPDE